MCADFHCNTKVCLVELNWDLFGNVFLIVTVQFGLDTLLESHSSLAQMLLVFHFIMVEILAYLRCENEDGKLKFNEFTASVEYSGRTGAGLSYDFCVFCFFKNIF